ncbi:type I polyketide synthase [Photorhabdus antumapuensis]|uniref:type I polyketide synthase n=1 Tax=Photorhabdus antumapuensis TaxID=2862867 RepID=UPI001CED84E7|nr:polyketide synthase [Photorhabdus antumapuensis]MCA6219928.1 polyketide synthase [Photorhabdus antumapuensis]
MDNLYHIYHSLSPDEQRIAKSALLDHLSSITPSVSSAGDTKQMPVAIVGMAFRLPGAEDSPDQMWEILRSGRSVIKEIPEHRFASGKPYAIPLPKKALKAGLLDSIDGFDAPFFGISPRVAAMMDPQQRMLLELTWQAIEDSGANPLGYSGSKTGVFIGSCSNDYRELVAADMAMANAYATTGTLNCLLANRLSFYYNFIGPSLQIDTACSSGLTALTQAVNSLRSGECQQAIVGSVNLLSNTFNMAAYYRAGMLSKDGCCRVFDADANGFVRGEGAVCLFLKTQKQALEDRDPIYGYVRASAVNHGGRANSLTSPNPEQQIALVKDSLQQAGISAEQISYLEAHGTGTSLGDPIEFNALNEVFNHDKSGEISQPCYIGSVKANIGHLEGAAGLAGIVKVLLMLQHKSIVPSAAFQRLNPEIDSVDSRLQLATEENSWRVGAGQKRFAGLSSFGLGGSNSHVILEEAPTQVQQQIKANLEGYYYPISANSQASLQKMVAMLGGFIESDENIELPAVSWTLQFGRAALSYRALFVATSRQDLLKQLRDFASSASTKEDQWLHMAEDDSRFLWLRGQDIDWRICWPSGQKPLRIRLPKYAFEHRRYWLPHNESAVAKQ